MENHVDNYLAWLKENMTQTKLENGLIEVTTIIRRFILKKKRILRILLLI